MKKQLLIFSLSLMTIALWSQSVEDAIKQLKWRAIGPANMGGRVTDIDGIPGKPDIFYISGADGGVFKTTNGGVTFEALFTDQRVYSVGALAVAPSDENVLWLGSGEGDPRNSVSYGNGVYRSIDGGQSWEHIGLKETERIKRIVVHPNDPDVACVCALGREWGPNKERGVFRTTDGGKNWEKVLYIDEDTGCSDLDIDFSNPRILYAGMWTHRRKPWRFDDGGKETAIYRSKDGGSTWEKIMNGLPDKDMARPGIQVAQSKPNTVYLITEYPNTSGNLFRSDDRGNSWTMVNNDPHINFRTFYYSNILVDPNDHRTLYSLSGRLVKSTDGGKTFETIAADLHGDHQSLWIDPMNSSRVLSGSDGGYQVSYDGGKTFDIINNVELSQYYQMTVDNKEPYNIYGGLQDNGTWVGPSNSLHSRGILKRHWKALAGGDGYYAEPIPGSEHEIYANLQGGVIFHVNTESGVVRNIHPYPKITGSAGDAIEDHKYRFNWDSPIHISPHDPNTVYFGGNVVFKSTDRGYNWEEISGDLTTNDKSKQKTSGGSVYQDNTAAEFHCSILTIAESPVEKDVIWIGTDDGNLQVTRDGGKSWKNVNNNLPGLPKFSWIAKIHASEHSKGTAFVAIDNHRSDDFTPYAYMTTNYGNSWTKIVNGLPKDDYVKVIRQDPHLENVLYAGMECGLYASWDKGANWTRINNNLPPVSVRDLRIHPRERDIIVGTHGRGIWVLDDARPITELAAAQKKTVHLYPVRDTRRWHMYGRIENLGQRTYVAPNPEYGAYINFYLKNQPEEAIKVEIMDSDGLLVRTIRDKDCKDGINRIVWDLRADEGTKWEHNPGGGWRSGTWAPMVPPGKYTAVLHANGEKQQSEFELKADPRIEMTKEDYLQQYGELKRLQGLMSQTHEMLNNAHDILSQLEALEKRMENADESDEKIVVEALEVAIKEMETLQNEWTRPPPHMNYRQKPRLREEIRSLAYAIDGATAKPTSAQKNRTVELREEVKAAAEQFEKVLREEIAALNTLVNDMPPIGIKRKKP